MALQEVGALKFRLPKNASATLVQEPVDANHHSLRALVIQLGGTSLPPDFTLGDGNGGTNNSYTIVADKALDRIFHVVPFLGYPGEPNHAMSFGFDWSASSGTVGRILLRSHPLTGGEARQHITITILFPQADILGLQEVQNSIEQTKVTVDLAKPPPAP